MSRPGPGAETVTLVRQGSSTDSCVCLDGRIAPRSGLAVKNFIDTGAGVIDADYRGEVKILLFNHADTDFEGTMNAVY